MPARERSTDALDLVITSTDDYVRARSVRRFGGRAIATEGVIDRRRLQQATGHPFKKLPVAWTREEVAHRGVDNVVLRRNSA